MLLFFPACGKKSKPRTPEPVATIPSPDPAEVENRETEEIPAIPEEETDLEADIPEPPLVEEEPEKVIPSDFEVAEERFHLKDYPVAVEFYESYLEEFPEGENSDTAFFRVVISHCLPESSLYSVQRCRMLLKQQTERFPDSIHTNSASILLSRFSELDRLKSEKAELEKKLSELSEEMEKLKSIDLRRRKDPPPR
jgi:hypothetical protein